MSAYLVSVWCVLCADNECCRRGGGVRARFMQSDLLQLLLKVDQNRAALPANCAVMPFIVNKPSFDAFVSLERFGLDIYYWKCDVCLHVRKLNSPAYHINAHQHSKLSSQLHRLAVCKDDVESVDPTRLVQLCRRANRSFSDLSAKRSR